MRVKGPVFMRQWLLTFAVALSATAAYAAPARQTHIIRITSSEDQQYRKIEICDGSGDNLRNCHLLGKKQWYSTIEINHKRYAIKQLRNRTIATSFVFTALGVAAAPTMFVTGYFGSGQYSSYALAGRYMQEIELAAGTNELSMAMILVESDAAVAVLRTALDKPLSNGIF